MIDSLPDRSLDLDEVDELRRHPKVEESISFSDPRAPAKVIELLLVIDGDEKEIFFDGATWREREP